MPGVFSRNPRAGVGEFLTSADDTGTTSTGFLPWFRAMGAGGVAASSGTSSDPSVTTGRTSTANSAGSGTIATSGGTAAIMVTSAAKTEILNPSTAVLWASWGTPAVNGAGSFPIAVGGSYGVHDRAGGTLTLLSTAATQPYTVNRFVYA